MFARFRSVSVSILLTATIVCSSEGLADNARVMPIELAKQVAKDSVDEYFMKEFFANDFAKLAAAIPVRRIDLNRDGKDEFIVQATTSIGLCGSGGCSMWIYRDTGAGGYECISGDDGNELRLLVDGIDQEHLFPTTKYSKGYVDLVVNYTDGRKAATAGLKYDGRRYRLSK